MDENNEIIGVPEAARRLGVSPRDVRYMIEKGYIKATKEGGYRYRFPASELCNVGTQDRRPGPKAGTSPTVKFRVEERRMNVALLYAKGLNASQIARALDLRYPVVHRDLIHLTDPDKAYSERARVRPDTKHLYDYNGGECEGHGEQGDESDYGAV